MADTAVAITAGTGTSIDTRTEATNGNHRQVVVIGDPSTNAGVAPVDATAGVKVNLGADNDVTLATLPDTSGGDLAAINTAVSGTLTVGSHAVTNAGTFAVQVDSSTLPTGAATAAKQPALGTAGTASSDVLTVQGVASMTALKVDGSGVTQPISGSVTADLGANNDVTVTGTVDLGTTDNAVLDTIASNTGDHAVTNAGTFAVQAAQSGSWSLAANQSVNVAQINGVTTTMGNGASGTGVQRVTIASDSTGQIKLAAGTAAVGKLTANSGVDIGDVTINNASGSPVYSHEDQSGVTSERVSDTGGSSTAFSNFGATASTYNYIRAITVYNSSATAGYVDFRDGTAGTILWTMPLPAGGGATLALDAPIFKTSANTALAYDVSGAISTVYISVSGYRSTT